MSDYTYYNGLTKREWFAGMAMQGILAEQGARTYDEAVKSSVHFADLLLLELSRSPEKHDS